MQSLCQRGENDVCTQCGTAVPVGHHRACPAKKREGRTAPARKVIRLGDLTKQFFESFGVTEERYVAVKEALHLDSTCKCNARQEWLNAMGDKLGVTEAAATFGRWYTQWRRENK